MKNILTFCMIFLTAFAVAQENQKPGISFSGFVKNDVFFDSRQTEALREGHFYLYPLNSRSDINGNDINAEPSFNILSIQSRLTGKISGPDALGAKTSGLLEGEFFGTQDLNTNGFRLRHAYGKLQWQKTSLLFGQTWHPVFSTECFPDVIAFNTGAPFQPFSRNPQIRFSYQPGNFEISMAALAQRDFTSPGGSVVLRNAVIPDFFLNLQYKSASESKHQYTAGAGAGYKTVRPRLVSDSNEVVSENASGFYSRAFFKYSCKHITFKAHLTYGQNLYNLTMLGGYAVRHTTDTALLNHDNRKYTTLDNLSAWIEMFTNGQKFQAGLFAGYSRNMGSLYNIMNGHLSAEYYFTRGRDISYLYRISPRAVFISGKMKFAFEPDYTVAAYGKNINSLGDVTNVSEIGNLRLLIGLYYHF